MELSKNTYVFNGEATAVAPLATCGPELSKTVGKNEPRPVPISYNGLGSYMYMPGAGLRSKLRGAATEIVRETLKKRQMKMLSLADAQLLRVGGIKPAGREAALDAVDYAEMIRKSPVVGLFGASTPWVAGKVMVGHLTCLRPIESGVFEPIVVDGVRTDILRRDPPMVKFLTDDAMDDYRATIDRVKAFAKIKAEIKDLERQAMSAPDAATRKALRERAAELRKSSKDQAVVSAQMPLAGYKAIPRGAVMESKIRLRGASLVELGCLLASIQRFAHDPIIGAHMAHGIGEISAHWRVSVPGVGEIGTLAMRPFEGIDIVDHWPEQPLQAALAAFEHFMAAGDLEPWSNEAILATDGVGGDDE